MIAGRIADATRVIGKSQGYIGLAVKDVLTSDCVPVMTTAWHPTPDEIARIVAGAPVYLHILGNAHPPVKLSVGDAPES
jgi:hypothetical protein